jgi:hypothetical protein
MTLCPILTTAVVIACPDREDPGYKCQMQYCEWWVPSAENPSGCCAIFQIAVSQEAMR